MKRFLIFASLLLIVGALPIPNRLGIRDAAPLFAQEKAAAPTPPVKQPLLAAPAPAPAAVPVSMSMAEFLAKYDKFLALGEARAAAEKKREKYEAAVSVLNEQLEERAAELRAQIPKGYVWDPAKREFVKPAAPEKKEKP